ncbi:hypothetical protein [Rhizobium sp. SG2393]|uniref:hypothetical protein n=1 Tax=Rhizobium sp. SG2393 TaxID=3276279 RepID=UPI00366EE352
MTIDISLRRPPPDPVSAMLTGIARRLENLAHRRRMRHVIAEIEKLPSHLLDDIGWPYRAPASMREMPASAHFSFRDVLAKNHSLD